MHATLFIYVSLANPYTTLTDKIDFWIVQKLKAQRTGLWK